MTNKTIQHAIEQLRRFMRGIGEKMGLLLGAGASVSEHNEADLPAAAGSRFDCFGTAVLSRVGITFKGIVFNDPSVTTMLNDLGAQARVIVAIKWRPSDLSSISVWNPGSRPHPCWIRIPIADPELHQGRSFWHHRIRDFATAQHLEFSTEEQRRDAYDRLRQHWEKLADQMPLREGRQAPRGLARPPGKFDDTATSELPEITQDDIVDVEASTAGLNKGAPDSVSDEVAAPPLDAGNNA